MVSDPNVAVKDTAAWTLGRVCERLAETISASEMTFVVQSLIYGLNDSARVGSNCAWAIINLSENLGADLDPDSASYTLSPYFEHLISALMAAGERSSAFPNYRASVFEAISSLVTNAPSDCQPIVKNLTTSILEYLNKTVEMQGQLVGADDKRAHLELQANLCSVLTVFCELDSNI
jgi:importin subunit beta-1